MSPLSFGQEGLWFIHRLEGPSPTYNIPVVLRLSGDLDQAALRAALNDVAGRHEALRTAFREQGSGPYQHVLPRADLGELLEVTQATESGLPQALAAAAQFGFDLAAAPPVRSWLFEVGPGEHVLLLLMHHIIHDEWSMDPLTRDLVTAYTARHAGRAPAWTPLPVQYADYAVWQREMLGDESDPGSLAARQLAYWREALAGLPEELSLPIDRPRPAAASYQGGMITFEVSPQVRRALRALARENQATLFMVLQASLAALLTRLGAGTDIPLGTPMTNRSDAALNDLIGYFLNTVVLRTDTSGDPSFLELVDRVRGVNVGALKNQDLPFDRLVQHLNPVRSRARHPLFQVMIALEDYTQTEFDLPGIHVTTLDVKTDRAMFDLSVGFRELGPSEPGSAEAGRLAGSIEYATDLFSSASADSLARRLVRTLAAVAANPAQRISQLDILDPLEREALLTGWNDTAVQSGGGILPNLFEAQAARSPDATAVIEGTDRLSYAELNARANQLARYLTGQYGAGPEQIVAVALPNGPDLIAALLGILKSGAAYLPVDPEYPAERIETMLAAAMPTCLITTSTQPVATSATVPCLLIDAAAVRAALDASPAGNPPEGHGATPANMAYVIFTSGSTGGPKGVVVEHGSLANYLAWAAATYHAVDGGTILHSSVSFDFTMTVLFCPLLAGGCIRIADLMPSGRAAIDEQGRDERISFLKVTPSHLALIRELPDSFSPTRQLLLCGEAALGAPVNDWRKRHPGVQVLNGYGPTEVTIECTCHEPDPAAELAPGTVPIGRPLWNTRVYVLDDHLHLAPIGVVGELYVAGAGLARGYFDQPAATAARFVACPFEDGGARMYRTGDLVRWRHDGQLEFAARADQQVKVRGHRVEPGEIEAALSALPNVRQAAVTVHDDQRGDKMLVGYVSPSPGAQSDLDPATLRSQLAAVLPRYMLPSVIVVLDGLPLTPNGKLDRGALRRPGLADEAHVTAKPRSAREAMLCGLFAELLGIPEIGIHDSFFDLGGHSLLAAQLVFRLREVLDADVAVGLVFTYPTVAELAEALDAGPGHGPREVPAEHFERLLADVRGNDQIATLIGAMSPGLVQDRPATARRDGHILLTGVTGFFGAFLLDELVAQTDAHISCLVRARDEDHAHSRIQASLERFGRWTPDADARITPVPGDLTQPLLGLRQSRFNEFAKTVDSIYHCAARVNIVLPFQALKDANISGTQELLRLAATTRLKHFHYISTDAVLDGDVSNSYVLTKRLAEEAVLHARHSGLPAAIYRMTRLMMDTRSLRGNPNDAVLRLLSVILRLAAAPDDFDYTEMWMPVDEAARLVIECALTTENGGLFTVVTPERIRWRAQLEGLRELGIKFLPDSEWVSLLRADKSGEHEVILNFLGMDGYDDGTGELIRGNAPEHGGLLMGPALSSESLYRYCETVLRQEASPKTGKMVAR